MAFVGADYQLAWPREHFVAEAGRLLSNRQLTGERRLRRATPENDLAGQHPVDQRSWLASLVRVADRLVPAGAQARYWPDRVGNRTKVPMGNESAQRRSVRLIAHFRERLPRDRCLKDASMTRNLSLTARGTN
jgi:hypothetical protein